MNRRSVRVQPARRVAWEVISAVRSADAYANLLLPARIQRAGLSGPDAALATELTYGTLRRRGYYDVVISLAARRDVSGIDPAVLDVLRLGCHQLLSMRTASHAAVDESVSLTRQVAREATGFVNAVLRTVSRETPESWATRAIATARGADERIAIEHSHPVWVVRALRSALAAEDRAGELPEALEADNAAPRVTLAQLPGNPADEPLVGRPTRYSPIGHVLESGDPASLGAVASGWVRVQDEGSQLAALTLIGARPVQAGERWLDLCAGPGGKAAILAAEAQVTGARFQANEIVPARAELVRGALAPIDPQAEITVEDGRSFGQRHPGEFDRILLDAPCTGLGALRRRPEARWRKSPDDVAELTALQRELLESAIAALSPQGVLAYVTCSPHPAETQQIVTGAIDDSLAVPLDTPAAMQAVSKARLDLPPDRSWVQLWPHRHGTDAMFVQLLAKPG